MPVMPVVRQSHPSACGSEPAPLVLQLSQLPMTSRHQCPIPSVSAPLNRSIIRSCRFPSASGPLGGASPTSVGDYQPTSRLLAPPSANRHFVSTSLGLQNSHASPAFAPSVQPQPVLPRAAWTTSTASARARLINVLGDQHRDRRRSVPQTTACVHAPLFDPVLDPQPQATYMQLDDRKPSDELARPLVGLRVADSSTFEALSLRPATLSVYRSSYQLGVAPVGPASSSDDRQSMLPKKPSTGPGLSPAGSRPKVSVMPYPFT